MNYSFMPIVLPCTDPELRTKVCQQPTSKTGPRQFLPASLEEDLALVIEAELDFLTYVERLKQELHDQPDFSLQTAFDAVSMFGLSNSNIDAQTLKQFLRHVGHHAFEKRVARNCAATRPGRRQRDRPQRVCRGAVVLATRAKSYM